MKNRKFKIGDNVRIIDCCFIEPYELNAIGIIVDIDIYDDGGCGSHVVDMGRPRRPGNREDTETCWWLHASMIELVSKPNEQLLFNFMKG